MVEFIQRNVAEFAAGALEHFPIVQIQGVRRAGKSTLAKALVENIPHVAVSLDDDDARNLAINDSTGLLYPATHNGQLMVIDEIQRVPELVLAVKAAVDKDNRPGRFIITGSSDFLALPNIPDSLAGRAVTLRLQPFSQGELQGRKEDFVTKVLQHFDDMRGFTSSLTRADYADIAWRGGYPESAKYDDPWRALWFDSYLERMTSRDAQDISERISAARLRAVLRLIAANQSGELVKAHLAEAAQISMKSVTTCLDTLKTLFLIDTVPPATTNLVKREIGRSKAVVSDTGLALRLCNVEREQLINDSGGDLVGHTIEGLVTTELLKQRTWSDTRWNLAHYRDQRGLEVDLVIELSDSKVILIEVKASSSYRPAQFTNIQKLAEKLGERFVAGIVFTTADHAFPYSSNLIGLPISALWE